METVLIVIHLMIVLALVGVVLVQRSEGGGLDIGGGSGFMTARGAANALTRATAILAAAFFATSLLLSILARYGDKPTDILDRAPATENSVPGGGVLDQLPGTVAPSAPASPNGGAAAPAPADGATTAPAAPAPAGGAATAPAAPEGAAQPMTPQVPNN
jgi:preprotein translocase subunit SecG